VVALYIRNLENWVDLPFSYDGNYQYPLIRNQSKGNRETLMGASAIISFNYALQKTMQNDHTGVHFFLDDYQFARIWRDPEKYVKILSRFLFITSPDFSLYTNMPKAMQIWNKYRNQWVGAFMQHHGITVIPTVSWSDPSSYEWAFDGIEPNGTVAVSSVGCLGTREALKSFFDGYNHMMEKLTPQTILFHGSVPFGIDKDKLVIIDPHQSRFNLCKSKNAL
jgi:hypothetical protein